MKTKLKKVIPLIIGVFCIFTVIAYRLGYIQPLVLESKFRRESNILNNTKFKDHAGADLYDGGIVEGIGELYKIYNLGDVYTTYKEKGSVKSLLTKGNLSIESQLIGKTNEVLGTLEYKNSKGEIGFKDNYIQPNLLKSVLDEEEKDRLLRGLGIGVVDETYMVRLTVGKGEIEGLLLITDGCEYLLPINTPNVLEVGLNISSLNVYKISYILGLE